MDDGADGDADDGKVVFRCSSELWNDGRRRTTLACDVKVDRGFLEVRRMPSRP